MYEPPPTTGGDGTSSVGGVSTAAAALTPSRRVPDIFLPPAAAETPPDLAPIPLEQQRRDIERIAALLGVALDAWPGGPATMAAPARDVCLKWAVLPEGTALRPSDLLRFAGWKAATQYLLVTVVAGRLEGWRWWGTHGVYPKAATGHFRRAAWLLRRVVPGTELYDRLYATLRIAAV